MAVIGAGTKFKIEDAGTPGTYITIPGILTFGDAGQEAELVDITPIDKTSNEYISGVNDGAELAITGNLEKANTDQALLRTAAKAKETHNFQIEYPDGTLCDFSLVLRGYKVTGPEKSASVKFSIPAKITGDVNWTEV